MLLVYLSKRGRGGSAISTEDCGALTLIKFCWFWWSFLPRKILPDYEASITAIIYVGVVMGVAHSTP